MIIVQGNPCVLICCVTKINGTKSILMPNMMTLVLEIGINRLICSSPTCEASQEKFNKLD